jgi:DNA topoisomerase-3
VLDYAQALYEKKLLTYPRTDSNYLTEDTAATVPELLEQSVSSLPFSVEVGPTDISRVIDASKVSDHHALLPTMQVKQDALAALPAGERNILTLVIVRLLCAVSEKQVYEDTAVELDCGGTSFAAKGRVVTSSGWKAVEQAFLSTLKQKPEKDDLEPAALPSVTEGQALSGCKAAVREGTTSPPKHFTEDICCERGIRNHP